MTYEEQLVEALVKQMRQMLMTREELAALI
jgi:hypothetical protein